MNPSTTNALLNYSLTTLPDPLQVSPATGNQSYGTLTFVVSNGGNVAVDVSQIQFVLPIGTLAQQLTNDAAAILYNSSPAGQWNISMTASGVFTAVPASGNTVPVTTNGIVFQLFNIPVNQQVGTVNINVNETATSQGNPSQVRTASFSVAKFPYGFFFNNFTPQVPMVQDKQTVTLTWQGSDMATYNMYYGAANPVPVNNVRTWTSPALTNDTTFLLRATVVYLGETVTRDLTTTVVVANPEIQGSSLSIAGISNLAGNTTIGGTLTANSSATIAGATTINNTLSVSGNATLATATVNQLLTASGGVSTSNLNASGNTVLNNVTINGTTAINSTVSMLKAAQGLDTSQQSKSVTVSSDGFVVVYATTYQQGGSPNATYWGALAVNSKLGLFAAGTANYQIVGNILTTGMASLSLPMANGSTFSLVRYTGSVGIPQFTAWWIPIGSTAAPSNTIREATAEEMADLPAEPHPDSFLPHPVNGLLVDALLDALKHPIDDDRKHALKESLKSLLQ